jgi:hypothetical protein
MTDSSFVAKLANLSDETFVHHAFVFHFRRICEPERAVYYLRQLRSGVSRVTVWEGIRTFASKELDLGHRVGSNSLDALMALDGDQLIRGAYRLILGRSADASGLDHYLGRLNRGENKAAILYSLLTSAEGLVRTDHVSHLRRWADKFRSELSIPRVLNVASVFRLGALNGEAFIRTAYRTIIGREADSDGLSTYLNALEQGTSKIRIIVALFASEEGRRRPQTIATRIFFKIGRLILG